MLIVMNSKKGFNNGNNITCLIEDIDNLSDNENFSFTSVELTNDPLKIILLTMRFMLRN